MKIITPTGQERGTSTTNYQADVLANGSLLLSNANLNFNNTATINVAVTANGSSQANIAFSVNTAAVGGGGGGNYQADVYANGTVVLANANLNYINTSTVNVSITANGTTQANLGFVANAAAIAGPAFAAANAANVTGQTAFTLANTANVTGQTAFTLANNANNNAANANTTGQTAFTLANTANIVANLANVTVLTAYAKANLAANQVAVYANGTLSLANANINFNNSSSINVAVTANGSTQANVTFSVNTAAINASGANATTAVRGVTLLIDSISNFDVGNAATGNAVAQTYMIANSANITAQSAVALAANAFILANADIVYSNGVLGLQTSNINFINTATVNASAVANGTGQVNVAFSVNTSAVVGGGGGGNYGVDVFLAGASIQANANLNFINTSSILITAVANGTARANISMAVNTAAIVGGANQQILFSNGSTSVGVANLIYNVAANLASFDSNVRVANGNFLHFGGSQANTVANSKFTLSYNATANALDIVFLG